MPKVSVIMPVYNSQRYLHDAIESVLNQTFSDLELIIVDDGSVDKSGEICDAYAEQDMRVRVIHKENGGICSARNCGLCSAAGEYITFCDHDDKMMPSNLEKTVAAIETEQADIVRFARKHIMLTESGKREESNKIKDKTVILVNDWDSYIRAVSEGGYGVWAGLYRKSFLDHIGLLFDEQIRYGHEDTLFVVKSTGVAQKIVILPEELYEWTSRNSVSTSTKTGDKIFQNRVDAICKWKKEEDKIGKSFKRTEQQKSERQMIYLYFLLNEIKQMNNMPNRNKKEYYISAKKQILGEDRFKRTQGMRMKNNINYLCAKYNLIWLYNTLYNIYFNIQIKRSNSL